MLLSENKRGRGMNESTQRAATAVLGEIETVLTGKDGTQWEIIEPNKNGTGRFGAQNILQELPGPTSLAKWQIIEGNVLSSFRLMIDDFITKHIQNCTENEPHRQLQCDSWTISCE